MIYLLMLLFSSTLAVTPNGLSGTLSTIKITSTKHLPVSPAIPARNIRKIRRTNKKIKGQRKIAVEQIAQSRLKELSSGKSRRVKDNSAHSDQANSNSENISEALTDDYDFGTILSSIAEDDSVTLNANLQNFASDEYLSPQYGIKEDSGYHPSDEDDDKPNWVSIDKPKDEDDWSFIDDRF